MRLARSLLILAALLGAGVFGSAAFNAADATPRHVTVDVVADADAFLAFGGYGDHRCFVKSTAGGAIALDFGAVSAPCVVSGGGSGLNENAPGDASRVTRFSFHDLLLVTNKGTKPVHLFVNATTQSGGGSLVEVAKASSAGVMTDASYAATSGTAVVLGVGNSAYVGVRLSVGTLNAASDVDGKLRIVARAG